MSHTHHNTHKQYSISNQNRNEFQNFAIRWKMLRGAGGGPKTTLCPTRGALPPSVPPTFAEFLFLRLSLGRILHLMLQSL